jgi:pyridoxamine 5'-phosphate oxidase family protein
MAFSDEEIEYLRSHGTGRLATVGADDQPDVVPVAVEFDGSVFWVGGGATVIRTRKFRNVAAGHHKVSLVIDDLPSFDPFIARGIRIYGDADQPFERVGMVGPGTYMRMASEPVGETWYESTRTDHRPG